MIEILINIGLGLVGTLIYTLFSIKKNLKRFDISKFIFDNKPYWVWVTLIQIAMALLIQFSPESAEVLKDFVGVDFSKDGSFVLSGWVLSIAANAGLPADSRIGNLKTNKID